jgi:hypothetical protein
VIDRPARNELIATIEDYLDERIGAFELDLRLFDPGLDVSDEAVRFVQGELWGHYDDHTDHLIVADKPQWDYFQRLILLLRSDREVVISSATRWTPRGACACLFLALLGLAFWYGHWPYLLLGGLAAAASLGLAAWKEPALEPPTGTERALIPFSGFAQIRDLLRRTNFRKRRYPTRISHRRVRSNLAQTFLLAQSYLAWICAAPLVLIVQAFPVRTTRAQLL